MKNISTRVMHNDDTINIEKGKLRGLRGIDAKEEYYVTIRNYNNKMKILISESEIDDVIAYLNTVREINKNIE